jgi:hypothetical protein
MEPMSWEERRVWIRRVWVRWREVRDGDVAAFHHCFLASYWWMCVRVTVALLLNNEVEPLKREAGDENRILAYEDKGEYVDSNGGVGRSWSYVQLSGCFGFIYGSDGSL